MSVLSNVLKEEKQRNLKMQKIYIDELNKLPKGSIRIKSRGNKQYCYLKYRENNKIFTKYIDVAPNGIDSENLHDLKYQVEKRKHFEKLIKELNDEYKMICKVIKD